MAAWRVYSRRLTARTGVAINLGSALQLETVPASNVVLENNLKKLIQRSMSKAKKASAINSNVYSIPDDFSSAASLLRALIATRKLLKNTLEDRAVVTALDLIGQAALSGKNEERLQAVSVLGKAAEISKPLAAMVFPLLKAGLRLPLPPIASWGSAEDRYYLAKGVSAGTNRGLRCTPP
jgi:hypothetical protein